MSDRDKGDYMKYGLNTEITKDKITQTLTTHDMLIQSHAEILARWVCDLRDQNIRDSLARLGWTPPETDPDSALGKEKTTEEYIPRPGPCLFCDNPSPAPIECEGPIKITKCIKIRCQYCGAEGPAHYYSTSDTEEKRSATEKAVKQWNSIAKLKEVTRE